MAPVRLLACSIISLLAVACSSDANEATPDGSGGMAGSAAGSGAAAGSAGAAGGGGAGAAAGGAGAAGASGGGGTSGSGGAAGSGGASGSAGASGGGGSAGASGGAGAGGFVPGPYVHVRPEDVGVILGEGVAGPAPTMTYSGPLKITSPMTLENVVVKGCLDITANNVVLRNVRIECGASYPVKIATGKDTLIEHSTIICNSMGKAFNVKDYRDLKIRFNDISGCEDFFFIEGDVDGLSVEHNYMHDLNLSAASHADGFQIGEFTSTTGQIRIAGNWIGPEAQGGKTDMLFATNNSNADITVESNYLKIWGLRTLRCGGQGTNCTVRTNVYEQAFESTLQLGNGKLLFYAGTSSGTHKFECNRFESGLLMPEMKNNVDRVGGTTHVTTNCPPPPK